MKSRIGISLNFGRDDFESVGYNLNEIGYDYVELGLGLGLPIKSFGNKLKKLRNIIPILSAHLPQIDYQKEEIEECKKFIEISSNHGINVFVIHLYSINLSTKDNLELKIRALQDLTEFVISKASVFALENTEEDVLELKKVFDKIPEISFCLDIGHANLLTKKNQSVNFIRHFGKFLRHIHIHDNVGGDPSDPEKYDIHLPVGKGTIKYEPIFEKLKEIKYSGNITIEQSSLNPPDIETQEINIRRVKELLL